MKAQGGASDPRDAEGVEARGQERSVHWEMSDQRPALREEWLGGRGGDVTGSLGLEGAAG